MALECVEPPGPQPAVGLEPLGDRVQALASDPVDPALRVDPHVDEAGVAEHAEVLGHGRLAHPCGEHEVADGNEYMRWQAIPSATGARRYRIETSAGLRFPCRAAMMGTEWGDLRLLCLRLGSPRPSGWHRQPRATRGQAPPPPRT